jgi:transcriptional repressor NF-X1
MNNIRCSQEKVSCGKPCGRPLGCGFHPCEQLCHAGTCTPCTTVCGKPRKLWYVLALSLRRKCWSKHGAFSLPAQHPCVQPCHAPSVCPELEPCGATITITCACGRIQQSVLCGRCTSSPAGRGAALKPHCTNECEIAKRNARLAEALGINPDMPKTNRNIVYADEIVTFARHNGKFVELVEKAFAEYVFDCNPGVERLTFPDDVGSCRLISGFRFYPPCRNPNASLFTM